MFPFIIKGKVPLGLRRDYSLSETGLQERIAERLVRAERRSEARSDGSHSGDGRGLVAGGLSRLRSLGFLTAVRVRKVRIITRDDFLFAGYEMDATVSTLVSMVIIPLVLGSILFSHSAFSFYEALGILILLVLTSWGLDIFILVMMVRHEIYQIASEIRAIMRRYDTSKIDQHHQGLSPEDLLATAYYYERNGLVRMCEAYLDHLIMLHSDTFEAALAREHMVHLEGIPRKVSMVRTKEGERKDPPAQVNNRARIRKVAARITGRGNGGRARRDENGKMIETKKAPRGWFKLPPVFRRRKSRGNTPGEAENRMTRRERTASKGQKRGLFVSGTREKLPGRAIRRRQERLERRDAYAKAPNEKSLSWSARVKLRLSRLLRWENREERRYRKDQERWLHGPRPLKMAGGGNGNASDRRHRRPNWMRSREERQTLARQKRWTEGLSGPGSIQKSRDRWGRWRLFSGESKADRQAQERRERAVEEAPYS